MIDGDAALEPVYVYQESIVAFTKAHNAAHAQPK